MSFENKKKHLEDFVDFSADMGILYVVMKVLSAVVMAPVNLARHPIGFIRVLFGYEIPQLILSWAFIARKIRFYKRVGIQCAQCKCWVSRDVDCPVCGHSHEMLMLTKQEWDPSDDETWYAQRENFHDIVAELVCYTKTKFDDVPAGRQYHGKVFSFMENVKSRVRNQQYVLRATLGRDYPITLDDCIDRVYNPQDSIIEEARIAYLYFIKGECPELPEYLGGGSIHPQTATRKKYEKIRCPKCGGFSLPTDPHGSEQHRSCTACGNQFDYSYNTERLTRG